MTLDHIHADGNAMEALRAFFMHPAFKDIRIAFTGHSPKGDDKIETSVEVAHGQYLGTRYVFNKIEEMVKAGPPQPTQKPKPTAGRNDPDLATR